MIIPDWASPPFLLIVAGILGWGVRAIISGQAEMNKNMVGLREDIGRLVVRVAVMEDWREGHEQYSGQERQRNEEEHTKIRIEIEQRLRDARLQGRTG